MGEDGGGATDQRQHTDSATIVADHQRRTGRTAATSSPGQGKTAVRDRLQPLFRDFRVQLGLVFLLALVMRLLALIVSDPGFYPDATMRVFYALEWFDDPFFFVPNPWPPLHIHLIVLALRLYPDPLYSPVLLSVFFGALSAVAIALLVREVFEERGAGLLAGLIWAFYPLGIRYSLVAMSENVYLFFLFVSLWALYVARRGRSSRTKITYLLLAAGVMSLAAWTHIPPWWVIPVSGLLLWGHWRELMLYEAIAAHPILMWLVHIVSTYGTMLPSNWAEQAARADETARSLGETIQFLTYYPNVILHSLSVVGVVMALIGILYTIKTSWGKTLRERLFPLLILISLVPAYLLFSIAWDRRLPKDALLAAAFLVPYAAFGSLTVLGLFDRFLQRALIVAVMLGLMLAMPRLNMWFSSYQVDAKSNMTALQTDLVKWFRENSEPEDAIAFDPLGWQDWQIALTLRKHPDLVYLIPPWYEVETEELRRFLLACESYIVLSRTESVLLPALDMRCTVSGCPSQSFEPALEAELVKEFETSEVVIYSVVQWAEPKCK